MDRSGKVGNADRLGRGIGGGRTENVNFVEQGMAFSCSGVIAVYLLAIYKNGWFCLLAIDKIGKFVGKRLMIWLLQKKFFVC